LLPFTVKCIPALPRLRSCQLNLDRV